MRECISSGAKRIIHSILQHIEPTGPEGEGFVRKMLTQLEGMPICKFDGTTSSKKVRKPREATKWQLCIKEERTGKPFDREALKKLSSLCWELGYN